MSHEMRFTRWLAGFGVLGGVAIALGLPWLVLVQGADLADWIKMTLVILGLSAGTLTAIASAVVGITIPTTVRGVGIRLDPACCEPEVDPAGRTERADRPDPDEPDREER
ncbi:MAG: hypothetical protein PVG07_14855 [Acidobacteriota bacterium]|jgi:hypothetical protein